MVRSRRTRARARTRTTPHPHALTPNAPLPPPRNNNATPRRAQLAHKAFDGLALGVPVYLARLPPLQTWGSLIFCAAMTPLGIGIGWAATSYQGPNSKLASAIILGMSAGSFLFISLLELLPSALHDGRLVAGKLTAFVVGFVAMAALAAYV